MEAVFATDPKTKAALEAFVGTRVPGGERGFGECQAMAVIDNGAIAAAVIFHDYNPETRVIEFSAASDSGRWLTRPALWSMFSYAFDYAGCQAVVMRVSERNRNTQGRGIQRILKAYGFTETRIENLAGKGVALMIYVLTDDAWRANGFHATNSTSCAV